MAFNMQTPLIGLEGIDKRSVHGEILGVNLLLEDVLVSGVPYIPPPHEEKSSTELAPMVKKSSVKIRIAPKYDVLVAASESELASKNSIIHKSPTESMKFVRNFLITWSQLENLKKIWGCKRLRETKIDTTERYKSFLHLYNSEIVQQVSNG